MIVNSTYKFPDKLVSLFNPAPYKVIVGGRGKSASWGFARALLILGERKKLFIVCGREIQKSIAESVKKLLEDQIEAMGYHEHLDEQGRMIPARYTWTDDEIRGSNGTLIVFIGVRTHVRKLKSYEGIDIFWAVEATHFSKTTWDIVMPTIRRDAPFGPFNQGSELWVDFNPDLATDYTYRYWVINPPDDAVVIHANWRDNPWFPERMQREMLHMKKTDYDNYLHIYEGKVQVTLAGAIYAKELRAAISANPTRVSPHFKIDRSKPVDVSCDLGRADTTSLLFTQQFGTDHLLGDYYGNVGFDWSHYLEFIQGTKYLIGDIRLPHDGKNKVIQARLSVRQQTEAMYPGKVIQVKRPQAKALSINAGRQLFPRICINEDKCADWLMAAQHFQYGVKEDPSNATKTKRTDEPLHNWASHPMEAYHTYCLGLRPDMIEDDETLDDMGMVTSQHQSHPQGWMTS